MSVEILALFAEALPEHEVVKQVKEACIEYETARTTDQQKEVVQKILITSRLLVLQMMNEKEGGMFGTIDRIKRIQEDIKTGERINNPHS